MEDTITFMKNIQPPLNTTLISPIQNAINDLQENAESSYNTAITEMNFYKNRCRELELGSGDNFEELVQRLSRDHRVPSLFLCESKAKIAARFQEFKDSLLNELMYDMESKDYVMDKESADEFVNSAIKSLL
ncbi:hypothetical protein BEWA_049040 [Theileria equi strain WA]|uniref:Uncharacterized protein n=1 Tax=Theileria equi strain WA TaxID=1537102 RepID=L1LAD3_THEEQ|nr:hypothetical protein BEWA_049040 [Theileria equi strain WA]EKX72437.1 hypothetical protein BEWA_049040 [Theileria equi strain WA]|eukprot:XP_004831889.1 hypothetical protein BEWA_049040 [Theileria equi strain WA]